MRETTTDGRTIWPIDECPFCESTGGCDKCQPIIIESLIRQ